MHGGDVAAKYQVFISSTFEDLREERDQVIRAVLEMGHIPVGMEMFSAADEEQWQIIARHIDESDYYVVIVAHRYGSVTEGISYTRKEYEYALTRKVPALGFIIEPSAPWPADRMDATGPKRKLLEDFKAKVREKPVSFWSTADELHSKCSIALMKAFTANPRDGWVRASAAVGPEVTAELSRLSAENAKLRSELEKAQEASTANRENEMIKLIRTLGSVNRQLPYRYGPRDEWQRDAEPWSLDALFDLLASMLLVEYSLADSASYLAMHVRADTDRPADIVPHNTVRDLLSDFMTYDLVQPSTRRHTVTDTNEYWSLTPYGTDVLKWLRRLHLSQATAAKSPSDQEGGASVDGVAEAQADARPVKRARPPKKKAGEG